MLGFSVPEGRQAVADPVPQGDKIRRGSVMTVVKWVPGNCAGKLVSLRRHGLREFGNLLLFMLGYIYFLFGRDSTIIEQLRFDAKENSMYSSIVYSQVRVPFT